MRDCETGCCRKMCCSDIKGGLHTCATPTVACCRLLCPASASGSLARRLMSVASFVGGKDLLNSSLLSNKYLHHCAVSRLQQLASFVLC